MPILGGTYIFTSTSHAGNDDGDACYVPQHILLTINQLPVPTIITKFNSHQLLLPVEVDTVIHNSYRALF